MDPQLILRISAGAQVLSVRPTLEVCNSGAQKCHGSALKPHRWRCGKKGKATLSTICLCRGEPGPWNLCSRAWWSMWLRRSWLPCFPAAIWTLSSKQPYFQFSYPLCSISQSKALGPVTWGGKVTSFMFLSCPGFIQAPLLRATLLVGHESAHFLDIETFREDKQPAL
jgi:hypothetical protein